MDAFQPELLFVESGGDNLAAQFSRELADYTIYVIDVSGGDKIPRKGGPASRSRTCWSSTRPTSRRSSPPPRDGRRREKEGGRRPVYLDQGRQRGGWDGR